LNPLVNEIEGNRSSSIVDVQKMSEMDFLKIDFIHMQIVHVDAFSSTHQLYIKLLIVMVMIDDNAA